MSHSVLGDLVFVMVSIFVPYCLDAVRWSHCEGRLSTPVCQSTFCLVEKVRDCSVETDFLVGSKSALNSN